MKNKRGVMLFQWILIIIAGAAILFFAIIVASKTGLVEQNKQNAIVVEYMDLLFNPFSVTGATAENFGKNIDLPYNVNLELTCEQIRGKYVERLTVGKNQKVSKRMVNFIYALWNGEATRNFYILTKPFEIPFRITDLIFVFEDKEVFCLISDANTNNGEIVRQILSDIDRGFEEPLLGTVFVPSDPRGRCPSDTTRSISFNEANADVQVIDESRDFSYGYIIFNEEGPSQKRQDFIGLPMIESAIFSDFEVYDCNFNRLMERVDNVAELYQEKSLAMISSQPTHCATGYHNLRNKLQEIRNAATQTQNMEDLFVSVNDFSEANRKFSCAQVY